METVPVLTSDNTNKRVLVLAHSFVPPERANFGFGLSIHPLKYHRSYLGDLTIIIGFRVYIIQPDSTTV